MSRSIGARSKRTLNSPENILQPANKYSLSVSATDFDNILSSTPNSTLVQSSSHLYSLPSSVENTIIMADVSDVSLNSTNELDSVINEMTDFVCVEVSHRA